MQSISIYIFNKQSMKNRFSAITFIIVCLYLLTSCASVKLTHGGEKARVLSSGEVANCQKRGATTVTVKPTILSIQRLQSISWLYDYANRDHFGPIYIWPEFTSICPD